MKSRTHGRFWYCYTHLPKQVQARARKQFRLFLRTPDHPSLQLKQIRPGLWSARVTGDYRALALKEGDDFVWFWIGTHAEYDQLLARKR